MPLLEAKSVKKLFGGVVALSSGNLTCEAGRITGLLGTNGSEKSTSLTRPGRTASLWCSRI